MRTGVSGVPSKTSAHRNKLLPDGSKLTCCHHDDQLTRKQPEKAALILRWKDTRSVNRRSLKVWKPSSGIKPCKRAETRFWRNQNQSLLLLHHSYCKVLRGKKKSWKVRVWLEEETIKKNGTFETLKKSGKFQS